MRRLLAMALCLGLLGCVAVETASPVAPKFTGGTAKALELAQTLEVKPMAKPDWAERKDKPLFVLGWIADLHIVDAASEAMVKLACHKLRDDLKPNLVMISGDNCGLPAPKVKADEKEFSLDRKRQLWCRRFLKKELALPYEILPGDNWPWEFDKVFGSFHKSFDICGYHFIMTDLDAIARKDGVGVFSETTWNWMVDDLKENKAKPTLLFMHETFWPPTYWDARKTEELLTQNPQVLATLSGHVHLDLDLMHGRNRQLSAPSLGRSYHPGFKLLCFYVDCVLLTTYEWQAESNTFEQASKWQRIQLPNPVAPKQPYAVLHRKQLLPSPKKEDNSLLCHSQEMAGALLKFMMSQIF